MFQTRLQLYILCVVFVLLGTVYLLWGYSPILAHRGGDNAYYLLTAQFFSPYSDASSAAEYFAAHNQYPPLYPLLLALFGGGESIAIAHIITVSFLLCAFVIFFMWVRIEGVSYWLALLLILVFAAMPGTYIQALSNHSEHLYLLLSLAALACISSSLKFDQARMLWYAAIFIGLASITRSVGITLIAAFIAYLFVNKAANKWKLSGLAIAPFVLWQIIRPENSSGYAESILVSYSGAPLDALIEHLNTELPALWYGWANNFSNSYLMSLIAGIIGVFCIIGLVRRFLQKKIDAYYLATYFALILIWPFPAEAQRFIFAVLPVVLFQGLGFLLHLSKRWMTVKLISALPGVFVGLIAIVILPHLFINSQRYNKDSLGIVEHFKHQTDWYEWGENEAYKRVMYNYMLNLMYKELPKYVSEDECVYSIKPSVLGLYAGLISVHPPTYFNDDKKFMESVLNGPCKYFFLVSHNSPSFEEHYYPLFRIQDSIEILKAGSLQRADGSNHIVAYVAKFTPSKIKE